MTYELLSKLGYTLKVDIDGRYVFQTENDYTRKTVWFCPKDKEFYVEQCDWYDRDDKAGWVPMEERKEALKHCATYGYWGNHVGLIDMELWSAINEVISSLGW